MKVSTTSECGTKEEGMTDKFGLVEGGSAEVGVVEVDSVAKKLGALERRSVSTREQGIFRSAELCAIKTGLNPSERTIGEVCASLEHGARKIGAKQEAGTVERSVPHERRFLKADFRFEAGV